MSERITYGHLGSFLDPKSLPQYLDRAAAVLETFDFDTLAFRGMSGAFLGPALAARLNKQMILVRKPEDTTHFRQDVEGYREVSRYIIVDDIMDSGSTKRSIIDAISEFAPDASFLGLLEVKLISQHKIDYCRERYLPYPLK